MVDYCLYDEGLPEDIAYFHAQWRRETVSYTHLDVYKRQTVRCAIKIMTYART